MLKLKLQYFGHLMQRANSLEKTLMLGKIDGKSRRGQQNMRWLDIITNSMDINLSKFQEIVAKRGAWCATVHGITKSWTWLGDWKTTTVISCSKCLRGLFHPPSDLTDEEAEVGQSKWCVQGTSAVQQQRVMDPSDLLTSRLSSLSDSWLPSAVRPILLFDDFFFFFFFFAVTGWLTQVSCNQTQLESSLPCRLQQSARGRVYGADVCAWHQPSHLFLVKDTQYTLPHHTAPTPLHRGIRIWIICKYISSLSLMVRHHKCSFQGLQNTVLTFLVVTAFDQCTLQNMLSIFYTKYCVEKLQLAHLASITSLFILAIIHSAVWKIEYFLLGILCWHVGWKQVCWGGYWETVLMRRRLRGRRWALFLFLSTRSVSVMPGGTTAIL